MKKYLTATILLFFFAPITICISEEIKPNNIKFNVYRNNSLIGYHKINFSSSKNLIQSDIEIKFEVTFLGFVVYEYFHKNSETWSENTLIKLNATTDKNGETLDCNFEKISDKFIIEGTLAEEMIYEPLIPTSYWNKILVNDDNKKILNTQDCSYIEFKITNLGKEKIYNDVLETSHYKLIGNESTGEIVDIDIWYNQSSEWVKMIFLKDGSKIEYILDEYDSKK